MKHTCTHNIKPYENYVISIELLTFKAKAFVKEDIKRARPRGSLFALKRTLLSYAV